MKTAHEIAKIAYPGDLEFINYIENEIKSYTKECCKATLIKASENVDVKWHNDYPFGKIFDGINKDSIIDIGNIVIL